MRFSKTSEYALRVLILMAREPARRYSVRELHEALELPQKYLARLMGELREVGILEVRRGQHGGYALGRDRDAISVLDVVSACEGDEAFSRCIVGLSHCSDTEPCPLHDTLNVQRAAMREAMAGTSLGELVRKGVRRLRD